MTVAAVVYAPQAAREATSGNTTITPGRFTLSQIQALLALAEPVLLRSGSGAGEIATTERAAARLGWTPKRFDKKIENICDKLTSAGVRGLRAHAGVSSSRRIHLVEYVVSSRLVTADDLPLLDQPLPDPGDEKVSGTA